jgi:hypothetical protein
MLFNAMAPVTVVLCFLLLNNNDVPSVDCLHLEDVDTVVAVWEVDVVRSIDAVAAESGQRGEGIGDDSGYTDDGGGTGGSPSDTCPPLDPSLGISSSGL